MPTLNLKPTHPAIQTYYRVVQELTTAGKHHEGALAPIFANLLRHCARQMKLRFVEQETLHRGNRLIRPDGILLDELELRHGLWEAKDSQEALEKEILAKFQQGYPNDNILFQSPDRLVIYQGADTPVFDANIADSPPTLVAGLKIFFEYQKPAIAEWQQVTLEFQGKMADLGKQLVTVLKHEYQTNQTFQEAFDKFMQLCQTAINPHLSRAALEEMLIQHLLTERIFTTVFNNPEFVEHNVIAKEINKVIHALTSKAFNRAEFIKQNQLARFYTALERTAATIDDYTEQQPFLNAVYERFFQGFAVKVADTHGIVYTPQPIVDFMVTAVQDLLQQEFGRSLADSEVQIIDPFVGTGNFMIRLLKEIYAQRPLQLEHKYLRELHCNEVMLLPYYIASMNIEHEFYELAGSYSPYEGICLTDTFELVEEKQRDIFVSENTQRVLRQTGTSIFVIIGNPPYNVGQQNENDNNKNRHYPALDNLVAERYAKGSKATSVSKLNDPYVKAFQWATWRLQDQREGIVAFVSNNGFLDNIAFDGMRKRLAQDFDKIYCLDLGGNIRKTPGVQNVFDIKVGVSINFLIKREGQRTGIFYAHIGDHLKKPEKLDYLAVRRIANIDWQPLQPDVNHTWLTAGLHPEFAEFIPLGTKVGKATKGEGDGVIFKTYSIGANTSRDAWVYHFDKRALLENIAKFIETYNTEVDRWQNRVNQTVLLDDFVIADEHQIKWSSHLKECLVRRQKATFSTNKIRFSLYRPFCVQYLFFDSVLTHRQGRFSIIFPTPATEAENRVISTTGIGSEKPFAVFISNLISDLNMLNPGAGGTQCFPFYTYSEDGTNRQENITHWSLDYFRTHYQDRRLSKWDIFYYVYGLLHHPRYRETYAANLKRERPRIPLLKEFKKISKVGKQLADLHLHYEQQPEYPLQAVVTPGMKLHYRVDKMRLSKDKESLMYNEALTLKGIPPDVFAYRLGLRSALEWVLDQYQVTIDGHSGNRDKLEWLTPYQAKTAKDSGILNDPNRREEERYILRLVGQVITVSMETVKMVNKLRESVPLST